MKYITERSHRDLQPWLQGTGAAGVLAAIGEICDDAGLFVVDRERNILFWSEGAETLLGFSASDVLGEHCLKANRCQSCIAGCGVAQHRTIRNIPLQLYGKDGQTVPLKKSGKAFFDLNGEFAGAIEILHPDPNPVQKSRLNSIEVTHFHGMVSRDPDMLQAFQVIRNVAETDTTVLIRGPSGSGKELVARALHQESHRKQAPFIAINCAALTPTLFESELFGHVKGAFTGAATNREGLFQQAHGGTLFLDEIAELSMEVQAKLLRVLEQREVVPVGANKPISVDVRVVAATHRGLRAEVKAGRFREDLMYRLRVVPVFLPPLKDRSTDIEILLWHFIAIDNKRGPRHVRFVDPDVMRILLHHKWPGNIRELRNVVEYAFAVGRGETLEMADLPPEFREISQQTVPQIAILPGTSEREQIVRALAANHGHIGNTAQMLKMSRPTLWRKRKKYDL